ncbi:alpha/beta fold hydrolase [Geopsychrobacter electrodiphilus]|uniref:alpha/beta fold hydrolase n=1 Tax=Geopsychrobacter electrodiphilus TaxID=225196 RepID=UPI00037EBC51|nr:alpha/beta hydrolase [Geopsychrobacter electrodiphilus]
MAWHPEIQTVSVGGYNYALLDRGAGDEAVVLIHGITTYSFIWRKILPLLPTSKRVIALDLLGCGGSDMPLDVGYSLSEHAERLVPLLQQLGVRRAHLVGHDVGGGVGQILAVRYPEILIDLCLINSVAYDYWPVQPITTLRIPLFRHFVMSTLDIGAFRMVIRRGLYHKDRLDPELLELFSEPVSTSLGRKAFLHFARCLDNRNLTSIAGELRKLHIPVLLIRGEADVYLSEEISLRLKREIPGCRLLRIPTAGHFIQEDEPELVTAALISFWQGDVVAGAVG